MSKRAIGIGLACWLAGVAVAGAEIEGRVISGRGTPVEHVRVELVDGSEVAFTGPDGRFRIAGAVPPVELAVSHPRFVAQAVRVAQSAPLEIVLAAKQQVFEEIAVSANRGEENFSPVSVAADVLKPEDAVAPASQLSELVATVPGVSENGQGGLFQTFSIRGVSRLRVLTLVSGMRVVGEIGRAHV